MSHIKTCENLECNQEYISISAKSICCCKSCSNRYNYLNRLETNRNQFELNSDYKKNFKILKLLLDNKREYVKKTTLTEMGFVFDRFSDVRSDENNNTHMVYNNIRIYLIDLDNYKIAYE